MKAVILAGGEGSRLRPLTLGRPKPMTPLLDKPVLGHLLDLLRRHGVTDVALTLRCLPAAVTDHFGDGAGYGVKLTYFLEEEPLGTAGGVKSCAAFLGEEDFFVLSGDAVTDLDLTALARKHRSAGAVASLALARRRESTEYGLVHLDPRGRVLGFTEKPGWGEVDTELVNTGIYLLSPRVLDLIPEGQNRDFARDIFPALLERGELLCGWELPGYWKDMGNCRDYLECVFDTLENKIRGVEIPNEPIESLYFSGQERNEKVPENGSSTGKIDDIQTTNPQKAKIVPPCWIAPGVRIAPGSTVGPYAVLDAGTTVETGAVVERSVLLGAAVGEGAEVSGALLCQGVRLHPRAMAAPGSVLGEGVIVGADALVAPGVKLWPGQRVAEGARCTASRLSMGTPKALQFKASGVLTGTVGEELTPEAMLALGGLLAAELPRGGSPHAADPAKSWETGDSGIQDGRRESTARAGTPRPGKTAGGWRGDPAKPWETKTGGGGQVAVGWSGGEAAALLGRALGCGASAAGAAVLFSDAPTPAAGAWLGGYYGLQAALFVTQDGDRATVRLTGPDGLPPGRERLRKLEGALLRGESRRPVGGRVGAFGSVTGVRSAYAAARARAAALPGGGAFGLPVAVPRGSVENDLLSAALTALGCHVRRGLERGRPAFSADWGGERLTAWDEEGCRVAPERLLVLLTLIECQNGSGQAALPLWAPTAAETVAEAHGARLLRLGRDRGAEELWAEQPWFWDAAAAACRLCARLGRTGETLAALDAAAPKFAVARGEVPLRRGRGRAMETLGLRAGRYVPAGAGWVCLIPSSGREALHVIAEAADMEAAAELCGVFEKKVRKADEEKGPER